MFRTSKCSSSGRLVHVVLWYTFHASIQAHPTIEQTAYMDSWKKYKLTPIFTGNAFQDVSRLRETADNTERYIQRDIQGTT